MHTLIQKGKVIFESARKIDAIFEHQNYHRRQQVVYKYITSKGGK